MEIGYLDIESENIEVEIPPRCLRPHPDVQVFVKSENIEVEIPPRCPQCKTELEETKKFWGGYKWGCVNCGFTKKNSESWYIERDRVEKIAKRKFEMERSKNRN